MAGLDDVKPFSPRLVGAGAQPVAKEGLCRDFLLVILAVCWYQAHQATFYSHPSCQPLLQQAVTRMEMAAVIDLSSRVGLLLISPTPVSQ